MKYSFKILLIILVFFSCTNEPKQDEAVTDTTFQSTEPPTSKYAPPVGMQGSPTDQQLMARGISARALPTAGVVKRVLENKDTLVQTTTTKTLSYVQTDIKILPFKGTPPPPPTNQPPTANAGIDKSITLPVSSTSLTGVGADPDGTITTYAWRLISGATGVSVVSPNAATTNITGLAQGAYTFRFTVTDNKGATATDDMQVTVNAAPPPPPTTGYLSLTISAAMDISGQSNVIIENKRFRNITGNAIRVANGSNITIRNCFFDGATEEAIEIEGASNVTITNCLFARVINGVYALSSQTIKVNNNQFVNVKRNAGGGRGQCVQFNNVSGSGNEVNNNRGENFLNIVNGVSIEGDPEDLISMYQSSGTASSPISIRNNIFRGGGPSPSGGGIMLGDGGGGSGGSYQIAENNVLLNPGNYGMAASGGNNIQILNNKIFAKQQYFSNNPLYTANYSAAPCSNITVKGNRVSWVDKNGDNNPGWNSGQCSNTPYNPSVDNTSITESELGIPAHLITFVTPAELLTIRK